MFVDLFQKLRHGGIPVSLTELLALHDCLKAGVIEPDIDSFYGVARLCLVKDERFYDRFDHIFGDHFAGVESVFADLMQAIPDDWLRAGAERLLSKEELAALTKAESFDALMDTLRERLAEQNERHQGGNKWIGTAGTSPFGAYGANPEGVRMGQHASRNRSAVKVWDKREFRNLDDTVELGTRNIKMALRRLRKFARQGAADELDLNGTIKATAEQAGLLDVKMMPERRNAIKVLLCLDIGGSMDAHVKHCETLFSAARSEFKHLEHYYFHNYVYEAFWRDNRRRRADTQPTLELIRTYGRDYKLIFVGDASMSPYEITAPGGSVEHWNEEAGSVWMQRLLNQFPHAVWLNPEPEAYWQHMPSTRLINQQMQSRMFPLTPRGIEEAMQALLSRPETPHPTPQ
ncbi:MAG: VWA domain-containing protein [Pseudomonadota bacterium]